MSDLTKRAALAFVLLFALMFVIGPYTLVLLVVLAIVIALASR